MLIIKVILVVPIIVLIQVFDISGVNVKPIFIESELSVKCQYKNTQNETRLKSCLVPVSQLKSEKSSREYAFSTPYRTRPPQWYNHGLAKIGQDFFKKNIAGYSIAQIYGFCLIASSTDYIRVFASGGLASTTIEKARERYLRNGLFSIYFSEVKLPRTFQDIENDIPHTHVEYDFFEFFNTIRSFHEKIGYESSKHLDAFKKPIIEHPTTRYKNVWIAFQKDIKQSKYLSKFRNKEIFPPKNGEGTNFHFNQFAMMIQFWAIFGTPLLFHEKVFMPSPKLDTGKDLEWLGYLHFFAIISYGLGVRDEYNLGLQPSIPEARKYYYEFMEEYLLPGLAQLEPESMFMMELAIEGIKAATVPVVDLASTLSQALNLLNVPTPNLYQVLNRRGRYLTDTVFPLVISLSQFEFYRNLGNNAALGVMQGATMQEYGININDYQNFTEGMKSLGEATLKTTNIWLIKSKDNNKMQI